MTTRRSLLRGAAVGGVALALGACVNGQFDEATAAQDLATIANGLSGALNSDAFAKLVPADKLAAVKSAVADLQTASASFASATTQAAQQKVVQRVETDVNAVVAALASVSLPAPYSTVVAAAQALLPVIEAAVGLAVPAQAKATAMAPASARLVLSAAAISAK